MNNEISIEKFLRIYYGVNICKGKLTHDDMQKLFNNIVRCPFTVARKNPELVAIGEIVYVYDKTGRIIPYLVSGKKNDINEVYNLYVTSQSTKQTEEEINISTMTTWELKQILMTYSSHSSIYREASFELKSRIGSRRRISQAKYEIPIEDRRELDDAKCKRKSRIK